MSECAAQDALVAHVESVEELIESDAPARRTLLHLGGGRRCVGDRVELVGFMHVGAGRALEEQRAEHGCERQRHEARDQHRDSHRDTEFVEQAPDAAGEERDGYEHRHQCDRGGENREADLLRAVDRRAQPRFSISMCR
jgi:hypothetical protein